MEACWWLCLTLEIFDLSSCLWMLEPGVILDFAVRTDMIVAVATCTP